MYWKDTELGTEIFVDEGETEAEVIMRIAFASYDLSFESAGSKLAAGVRKSNMEKLKEDIRYFNPNKDVVVEEDSVLGKTIKRKDILKVMDLNKYCVLRMEYVNGRCCVTTINRLDKNHLLLDNKRFETDRGSPEKVLEFAKKYPILSIDYEGLEADGPLESMAINHMGDIGDKFKMEVVEKIKKLRGKGNVSNEKSSNSWADAGFAVIEL